MIKFMSGVLQGCPGSAFLFNSAIDPFFCRADRVLREANRGIIRGCGDDLGISLSRLKHLGLLAPTSGNAQSLVGLTIKAPKCILVSLCTFSRELARAIAKWLRRNIPHADFAIHDCTDFMGIYVVPGAGKHNLVEQTKKIQDPVQSVEVAKASVRLGAHTYNIRVVPCVGFVVQLPPYAPQMDVVDRAVMHTCLGLPQNALCHADFFHLQQCGGLEFRSISAAAASHLSDLRERLYTLGPNGSPKLKPLLLSTSLSRPFPLVNCLWLLGLPSHCL